MHRMNLSSLDLNLLLVLRALLAERSVTRAAKVVGLSQPATSHALSRLRAVLGDPLFVRAGKALVPTPRAESLAVPLEAALVDLERALTGPAPFDPATAKRSFTVATSDYGALVLLAPLLARLSRLAPNIDLRVRDPGTSTGAEWLASGEVDVAFTPALSGFDPPGTRAQRLFSERFVCLVRKGHPRVKEKLTLKAYAELPHAFIAPRGTRGGVVDDVLRERGLERRVALLLPGFLVAPQVIARSDLIVTLGERVARSYAGFLPLRILQPPVPLPGFSFQQVWHERVHADPAQAWLRSEIAQAAREV
jgi:DNA-binding transcriptional LysR family regulator